MKGQDTEKIALDVSVLIPISERHDNLTDLFLRHQEILQQKKLTYEFIFVLDGSFPSAEKDLEEICGRHQGVVKVIKFNKYFGEAKAITAAYAESSGRLILTLASYYQVEPKEIEKLFTNITDNVDVVFGSRYPRKDNLINRLQSNIFHSLSNLISGESFNDISCGVRLLRRNVLEKINLYGDMHRFIPLLAIHKGFQAKEVPLQQAKEDIHLRIYRPGVYLRRLLDLLTLFFLIKFTQKPLRFFGLLGCGIGFGGLIISFITVFQRFFGNAALSERPLFLAGILFLLVGLQTFFIGLVAEIIIYMHMPSEPEYNVEKIIQ